jgi:O-antigen/teichoic acid export membrane protein
MLLLAGAPYEAGHVLIPWLAVGTVLSGMYIFMPGLWLTRDTHVTLAINVASAVVAVVLTVVLAPALGMVGAALATLGGGAANFLAIFVMSQKRYRLPIESGRILAGLMLFVLLSAFGGVSVRADGMGHLLRAGYAVLAAVFIALTLVPPGEAKRLAIGAWRALRLR